MYLPLGFKGLNSYVLLQLALKNQELRQALVKLLCSISCIYLF